MEGNSVGWDDRNNNERVQRGLGFFFTFTTHLLETIKNCGDSR